MKIISNTTEFHIGEETAVAIGKFDGFHRGHQELLARLKEEQAKGLKAVVFTFVPSPASFFAGDGEKELTTVAEKRRIFESAGIDLLIEYPFDRQTADMEPEAYIRDVLAGRLNARCIVAGDDVTYGRRGAGDHKLLEEKAAECGYRVLLIKKVLYQGKEISSTYVRDEVKNGNMELVAALLGSPYHVGGKVVHGRQLGRTIGIPTVNLRPPGEKLLPPRGVYHSCVGFPGMGGRKLPSITNIGIKPTVDDVHTMGVETYIYDFDQDVYGSEIEVYLLRYERPEMHFDGIGALREQMEADIRAGRAYHEGNVTVRDIRHI